MKTLYIECNMGAAGDMLMGALLELLPDPAPFLETMDGLGIPDLIVRRENVVKSGIVGTHMSVRVHGQEEESLDVVHRHIHDGHHDHIHGHDHERGYGHMHVHDHGHKHEHDHGQELNHSHVGMGEITEIIEKLSISEGVKRNAMAVYGLIAKAESAVHGKPVGTVHFHELGMMDAVADIVGVCLLMELLGPDRVVASPVHVGSGQVRCAHGIVPVPAPATALILEGIPSYGGEIQGELCTPTGAALLKYFVQSFGPQPSMAIKTIGYGMGSKDFLAVNCVRAFLGEEARQEGEIAQLVCNLDDMTGEDIAFALELLLSEGALDAFTVSIQMKKNRPGIMLVCLCSLAEEGYMAELMLRHTSTFGVRRSHCARYTLERDLHTVDTPNGPVRVKEGRGYGMRKTKVEYEDLARIAQEQGMSLAELRAQVPLE